jgi:hypothetical protein
MVLAVVLSAAAPRQVCAQTAGVNDDCTGNGAGVFPNPDGIHNFTVTGGQVSGAGATLFLDFFASPASTNDWIDADGDGRAGFFDTFPFVDQLASQYAPGQNLTTHWLFQYRAVGSVNGFNEFVESQTCHAKRMFIPGDTSAFNGVVYAAAGVRQLAGPYANPSGTPLEPCEIEFAAADVPSVWAVQAPGEPAWFRKPTQPGYGLNPVLSSTGYISHLQTLSRSCGTCTGDARPCTDDRHCNGTCNGNGIDFCVTPTDCPGGASCVGASTCTLGGASALNQNFSSPDHDTIFDKFAAWVPIALVANRGAGVQRVRYTDAQYLFTTGRMPNGENLTAATRSVGSGTRNASMNSLGIDTSWARGDNVGNEVTVTAQFNLGPGTQQSNGEGSGQMEQSVEMHRLAIGYTGLGGSSRAIGDALAGAYGILNTCKDIDGADPDAQPDCDCTDSANYVRPSIGTVLHNCDSCTGYTIGGQESFVLRGNPDANRDPFDPYYNAADPPLDNQEVARYMNNIFDSVASFDGGVFAGECFASETCSIKQCSGAPPNMPCTGTGQGTCPSGQTCNSINCVANADCSAITAGTCDVPRKCNSDTPCTTKTCSQTGLVCTVDGDCPDVPQTCDAGLCSIDGQTSIDSLDCVTIHQTCRADFCKSKLNMPGQFLANTFFLPNSIDCIQGLSDGVVFTPNPTLNQAVQDFVRFNNGLGVGADTPALGSVNVAGKVPKRNGLSSPTKYSDGSSSGSYTYWDGSNYVTGFSSGQKLSKRNQIAGDFNEDFLRDINDAVELVKACYAPRTWQQTARGIGNGTTGFDKGNQALDDGIPEVMGDFNGDGNFDKEDLRYFADGLAIVAGKLDRKQGAIAIDTAIVNLGHAIPWADARPSLHVPPASQPDEPTQLTPKDVNDAAAPFLKTGKAYQLGDFRGDVAGGGPQTCVNGRCSVTNSLCTLDSDCPRTPPTAGAQPMGWDGSVDAKDIDYCCRMAAIGNWSNLDEAVLIDLSCDMNGDLKVDADDITELVEVILGTGVADVNLDGQVDPADRAIVLASINTPNPCNATHTCGWADGDTNCDGVVDSLDLAVFASRFDVDGDGDVDLGDFAGFPYCLTGPGQPMNAGCERLDFDQDGDVDMADFSLMQTSFTAP